MEEERIKYLTELVWRMYKSQFILSFTVAVLATAILIDIILK